MFKFSAKTKKTKLKNKWTLSQFIFWGFNFTVGYAFIVGLNKSFAPVGVFLPAIMFIGAFISFTVGLSFARMSQKYASNGGAYLYVKNMFGKKTAYYAGFFQYIQAPIVALSAFLGMLWAFNGITLPGHSHAIHDSSSGPLTWWVGGVAAFLFILAYIIMTYGFTSTKFSLYFLWFVKWVVILLSMILALLYIGKGFGHNISSSESSPFHNPKGFKLSTVNIIQSTITFFFAFGGFEGIAVVSEDLENPKKNMFISLLTIIILAFCFYLFYYFLIIGALGSGINPNTNDATLYPAGFNGTSKAFDINPINILIQNKINHGKELTFGAGAAIGFLLFIVICSQLANKSTSRLMNGWVNARILGVIAEDGFLPVELAAKNKYGQLKPALLLDLWLSLILILVFYPLYIATGYNIADAIDLYTIGVFIQYLFVLLCTMKEYRKNIKNPEKKEINIFTFEFYLYILMFLILVFIIIAYFYFGFKDGISSLKSGVNVSKNIGGIATTITTIILIFAAIALFYIGKALGWHDRAKDDFEDLSHHHDLGDIESQPSL